MKEGFVKFGPGHVGALVGRLRVAVVAAAADGLQRLRRRGHPGVAVAPGGGLLAPVVEVPVGDDGGDGADHRVQRGDVRHRLLLLRLRLLLLLPVAVLVVDRGEERGGEERGEEGPEGVEEVYGVDVRAAVGGAGPQAEAEDVPAGVAGGHEEAHEEDDAEEAAQAGGVRGHAGGHPQRQQLHEQGQVVEVRVAAHEVAGCGDN